MPALAQIVKSIRSIGKEMAVLTEEGKGFFKQLLEFFFEKKPGKILTEHGEVTIGRYANALFQHVSHMSDVFILKFAGTLKQILPGRAAELNALYKDIIPALRSGDEKAIEAGMKRLGQFIEKLEPKEQQRLHLFFRQFACHMEADTAPVIKKGLGLFTNRAAHQHYEQVIENRMAAAAKEVGALMETAERAIAKAPQAVRAVEQVVKKVAGEMAGKAKALRGNTVRVGVLRQAGRILTQAHGLEAGNEAKTLHQILSEAHPHLGLTVEDVSAAMSGRGDSAKLKIIHSHTAQLLEEGVSHLRTMENHMVSMLQHKGVMTSTHYTSLGHGLESLNNLAGACEVRGTALRNTGVLKHHHQLIQMGADPLAHVQANHAQRPSITRNATGAAAGIVARRANEAVGAEGHAAGA